jgi:hypothetical protein
MQDRANFVFSSYTIKASVVHEQEAVSVISYIDVIHNSAVIRLANRPTISVEIHQV